MIQYKCKKAKEPIWDRAKKPGKLFCILSRYTERDSNLQNLFSEYKTYFKKPSLSDSSFRSVKKIKIHNG